MHSGPKSTASPALAACCRLANKPCEHPPWALKTSKTRPRPVEIFMPRRATLTTSIRSNCPVKATACIFSAQQQRRPPVYWAAASKLVHIFAGMVQRNSAALNLLSPHHAASNWKAAARNLRRHHRKPRRRHYFACNIFEPLK